MAYNKAITRDKELAFDRLKDLIHGRDMSNTLNALTLRIDSGLTYSCQTTNCQMTSELGKVDQDEK